MDYQKIYLEIVSKAKTRILEDVYVENHHILPRCMGGQDTPDNLVDLTAREHYICHQLLVKIYPTQYGLIYAAMIMCCGLNGKRSANRQYEWLKRKFSVYMSEKQTGKGNSQYGTMWVVNLDTAMAKKIARAEIYEYLDTGWIPGRTFSRCTVCSCSIPKAHKYCVSCRPSGVDRTAKASEANTKVTDDQMIEALKCTTSVRAALRLLGISETGATHTRASALKKKHNL